MTENQKPKDSLRYFADTDSGEVLTLRPVRNIEINLYLKKVRKDWVAEGRTLDPPQYRVRIGNPEKDGELYEYHDHRVIPDHNINTLTEEYVPDPEELRLAKVRWNKYEQDRRDWAEFQRQAATQYLMYAGVEQSPEDDAWAERLEAVGIEVPEDPVTRKCVWLEIHHGLSDIDMELMQGQIAMLSRERAVDAEVVESFFRAIRTSAREAVGTELERLLARLRDVAGDATISGADGGDGVGDQEPERVGRAERAGQSGDAGPLDDPQADDGVGAAAPTDER